MRQNSNESIITFIYAYAFSTSCALASAVVPAVITLSPPVAHEITVEQLARVLPTHPVRVGFAVDDTIVFSTPAFAELDKIEPKFDPAVTHPKDYKVLTPEQKKQYQQYWNKLNEELDDRSIPRTIGKSLLELHARRGDEIFIISTRPGSVPVSDAITKRYEKMFEMKFKHKVIHTQLADKAPFIAQNKIEFFYGDADSDILSAVGAKATPIRVKRGKGSSAKDAVHNGELNEIVLTNPDEK